MSGEARPCKTLLVATALEETWAPIDDAQPVVFLAPWCRRYSRRAEWGPLGGVLVADPWATPKSLIEGVARVREMTERSLSALSATLGQAHGERWGEREARILLGPWLLSYVPAQLDRWERLASAVVTHPRLASRGLPSELMVTPVDTIEAVQLLKGDRYNLQLMTPMMRALGIELLPAEELTPEPRPVFAGHAVSRSTRRRLADAIARSMVAVRGGQAIGMRSPHFPRQAQLRLVRALRLAAMPVPTAPPMVAAAAEPALRCSLRPLDLGEGAFERHLAKGLIDDLPTCFLEGYRALEASANAMGSVPAAVLSANAWHYDEPFKRWVASGAEAGSLLLGVQHGGNYGIDEYSPSEDHETAIADRFYTWGWTREDVHATTVAMPAPKLVGRQQLPADPDARGILFVATSLPRYPMQLDYDSERFERYLARQGAFLSAVPEPLMLALRVRPHCESLGWDIPERITDAHPDVAIESWDVDFAASLAHCRLFVCDHLSTTFAEALGVNKPTVLFWDPVDTRVRGSAADVFDELRSAGILHDTAGAAAQAVADAYADVDGWWSDPDREAAVTRFRERYARTDARAIALWAEELARVIR